MAKLGAFLNRKFDLEAIGTWRLDTSVLDKFFEIYIA